MIKAIIFTLALLSVLGGFWCLMLSVENYVLAEIIEKTKERSGK